MIDNCMNYLLSVTQHKVFKYYSKLLERQGITSAQAGVLTYIWSVADNKTTPKEIGKKLHLEAPTVSGILDKMQKLDLINREVDPDNRRIVFVTPTNKAKKMRASIESATKEMNQQVLKNFSSEEAELLKQFLTKLIHSEIK
ncbi:MarR family winged helix-turn-helix transcriptional regulator [Enterococcus faecalis]|uniref:MarR family winged helix-turn-helix transcriptional regulator n=1 Tax=Enterococcus faecalis TaxID=1351 RepID=UPI0022E5BFAE|nr:MarR family winged helix-turn-helix transcriptional regulator [Enterococcus faecalis]